MVIEFMIILKKRNRREEIDFKIFIILLVGFICSGIYFLNLGILKISKELCFKMLERKILNFEYLYLILI